MAAEAAAAERAEQILQRFESKKINRFVGDFEARFGLALVGLAELAAGGSLRRRCDLRWLLRINEAFVGHAFHDFIEEILHGLTVQGVRFVEHFAELVGHGVFGKQVAFLEGAEDGFAKGFHGALGIHLRDAIELGFESALQEKIAKAFDEFFEVDGVGRFAGVFGVADEFHGRGLERFKVESWKLKVKSRKEFDTEDKEYGAQSARRNREVILVWPGCDKSRSRAKREARLGRRAPEIGLGVEVIS